MPAFRVHYPIKVANRLDEVIVFLGASYFPRHRGAPAAMGFLARGLAVDTRACRRARSSRTFASSGSSPLPPGAKQLVVYSRSSTAPSVAGAYRFVVTPGEQTVVGVESRLFLRKPVEKLGIAPLTSMFYFGENTIRTFPDRTALKDHSSRLPA